MKGATKDGPAHGLHHCNFNPRTHEGCDVAALLFRFGILDISIHTPMKGATSEMEPEAVVLAYK